MFKWFILQISFFLQSFDHLFSKFISGSLQFDSGVRLYNFLLEPPEIIFWDQNESVFFLEQYVVRIRKQLTL